LQDDEVNGNFNRSSKTLSAVEVDLQLGHRGRGEISFASTQTETEETSKEETEVSEKISLQTEDREVQTEEIEKEKEEEEKPQFVEEISKEEKEIQTTLTETVSLTESSCQTEEICRDEIARQNSVEICLGTTTPLDEKGEEGGRTSACTQTLVEGVCSVEVQTDIDQEDGQIEYRGGQRPPTYPGSPGTELVNFI
jgi:hypothetical protein